jgi:ATP-dependent Clp protease protease subunit
MKSVLLSLVLALTLACPSVANTSEQTPQQSQKRELVVISKRNTVVLRGVVDDESVTALQKQLFQISQTLKSSDVIYLVLDTPGGSVDAGLRLIDFVQGLPQKVKTITIFAASMGFQIVQNLDQRLITPNGELMSHRARLSGMAGEINGNLLSRVIHITNIINRMDKIASARMNMSLTTYQSLIADELWMNGDRSMEMNAADKMVVVRCDASFAGSTMVRIASVFGVSVSGTMSNCPLITGVTAIELNGGSRSNRRKAMKFAKTYASDKAEIVRQYTVQGLFYGL